jgi:hypothetical protein
MLHLVLSIWFKFGLNIACFCLYLMLKYDFSTYIYICEILSRNLDENVQFNNINTFYVTNQIYWNTEQTPYLFSSIFIYWNEYSFFSSLGQGMNTFYRLKFTIYPYYSLLIVLTCLGKYMKQKLLTLVFRLEHGSHEFKTRASKYSSDH